MGDWSQLPIDLLHQVMDRLTLSDLIRFGCVCSPWRSVSAPAHHKGRLPWLIISSQANSPEIGNVWNDSLGFYSLLDGQFHKITIPDIPEIKDRRICGSSNGWLITIHENADIHLIHPFSRRIIELPSLNDMPGIYGINFSQNGLQYIISDHIGRSRAHASFEFSSVVRDSYIRKAIIGNSDTSLVVMGLLGRYRRLFYCRPGMNQWKIIEDSKQSMYWDVTYYQGQFYAVEGSGSVVVVEGLDSQKPSTRTIVWEPYECDGTPLYLVESSGDLLKVVRIQEDGDSEQPCRTICFKVLKLDFENSKWVEVENLGDHALFLGWSHSSSISTSSFPGCKPNCIYFTDDCRANDNRGYDKCIYYLEDSTIEAIYPDDCTVSLPQPIWYAPMLGHC